MSIHHFQRELYPNTTRALKQLMVFAAHFPGRHDSVVLLSILVYLPLLFHSSYPLLSRFPGVQAPCPSFSRQLPCHLSLFALFLPKRYRVLLYFRKKCRMVARCPRTTQENARVSVCRELLYGGGKRHVMYSFMTRRVGSRYTRSRMPRQLVRAAVVAYALPGVFQNQVHIGTRQQIDAVAGRCGTVVLQYLPARRRSGNK